MLCPAVKLAIKCEKTFLRKARLLYGYTSSGPWAETCRKLRPTAGQHLSTPQQRTVWLRNCFPSLKEELCSKQGPKNVGLFFSESIAYE